MDYPQDLSAALRYFTTPENCHSFLVSIRWRDGVVRCPRCGSARVTYLAKAGVWKCYAKHPKQKFSTKTGTIFEHCILGLNKLLVGVWVVVNCKKRPSSYALASVLQVSQKSAWRLLDRIHAATALASERRGLGEK